MHQILIVDDAEVQAQELIEMLRCYPIVVLGGFMRGQGEPLRDEAMELHKTWRNDPPYYRYDEPEVIIDGDPWWMPTMIHSELNLLNFWQTQELVKRTVQIWVARGSSKRFIYTNTTTLATPTDDPDELDSE